jgi:hypothetical protein
MINISTGMTASGKKERDQKKNEDAKTDKQQVREGSGKNSDARYQTQVLLTQNCHETSSLLVKHGIKCLRIERTPYMF